MPYNSLEQGEPLQGWLFRAVRFGTDDFKVYKCDADDDSRNAIGILISDPDTPEAGVSVSAVGDSSVRAIVGEAVVPGDWLCAPDEADLEGKLQVANPFTSNERLVLIARAMQNGVADQVILVMPMHQAARGRT